MPTCYQRRLPHWRVEGESIYFVTWRLHTGQPELDDEERSLVGKAMRHFDGARYELLAWVVMNDHIHGLLTLAGGFSLCQVLHTWKSFTAHQLRSLSGRPTPVWQDESFDRVVRDEEELRQKIDYIAGNPNKRWPDVTRYKWVWTKWDEAPAGGTPAAP